MRFYLILVCFICGIVSVSLERRNSSERPLLVHTNYGPVQGFKEYARVPRESDPSKVHRVPVAAWLGIPFAEPPVGSRRFRAPIPRQAWTEPLMATAFQPSCYQQLIEYFFINDEKMWLPPDMMSEDCLYLNIWMPSTVDPKRPKLPVLVWIYGGGFISGTANLPLYDGRVLAATNNVIVVTFQYRVGMLGFLYMGDEGCPGNQGMLDQYLAIRWVFENIEYFGGDQMSITIFGESSGGVSVGLHVLSPMSSPYFNQAIMQSGSPTASWSVISADVAENRTRRILSSRQFLEAVLYEEPSDHAHIVKASILNMIMERKYKQLLQYLRRMPVAPQNETWNYHWSSMELAVYSGAVGYGLVPVVDGRFIVDNPRTVLYTGQFNVKSMILGTNKDEGTYFNAYISSKYKVNLSSTPPHIPKQFFKPVLEEAILTHYPAYPYKPPRILYDSIYLFYADHNPAVDNDIHNAVQLGQVVGDLHFSCPVLQYADFVSLAIGASNDSNVFVYYFTHVLDYRGRTNQTWPRWMGSMHGDEIVFVFGDPWNPDCTRNYTREEMLLSIRMMQYWTNFAKYGDPCAEDKGCWLNYKFPVKNYLEINLNDSIEKTALKANVCYFWDQYVPQLIVAIPTIEKCSSRSSKQQLPLLIALYTIMQIVALIIT